MSQSHTSGRARGAIPDKNDSAAASGIADWLCLAATPIFATMALFTAVLGSGSPTMLCMASSDASPLSGMALMYGLMSLFHAPAWLRLIAGRRSGVRRL